MNIAKRYISLLIIFSTSLTLFAENAVRDSLLNVLKHTDNAPKQIALLINLLDLSTSSPDEFTLASQLYNAALKENDKFALSVSLGFITVNMIDNPEKEDSLSALLNQAQTILEYSQEEGIPEYYQMTCKARILQMASRDERAEQCNRIQNQINIMQTSGNQYQKVSYLFLSGVIRYLLINLRESYNIKETLPYWEEAWKLTEHFPPTAQKNFTANIYVMLSFTYQVTGDSKKFIQVSEEYLKRLDRYFAQPEILKRRPYIYKDDAYLLCYRQLMLSHNFIGKAKAHEYYLNYCDFVKNGRGDTLLRNKLYFYQTSRQYYASLKEYDKALSFCDSLINLIESGQAINVNYSTHYLEKARLLREMKRPEEACKVYERASYISDSLVRKEQLTKISEMQVANEISELELEKATLRSTFRFIAFYCTLGLLIIAALFSIHFYLNLKRMRKLQKELIQHTQKAQESEIMKSAFIKSICEEVRKPLDTINNYTNKITNDTLSSPDRSEYSDIITENCKELTTSLDHILESAYNESSAHTPKQP